MAEKKKTKKKTTKMKKTRVKPADTPETGAHGAHVKDPAQEEAIAHKNGPLLVVAGAGTGKTRVITERIVRLIADRTAEPSQILALTFSERAAREMERRVDELVPYGVIDTRISTFHSFGHDIINESFAELKIAPDWRLINEADAVIMAVENIDRFNLDLYMPLNNPALYLRELISFISKLKDNLITPPQYSAYAAELEKEAAEAAARHSELSRFYAVYEKIKEEKNLMDYGDLIMAPYFLFRDKKSVLERYRRKYKYLLVDEFQDTNYAQFELIKLLSGKDGNIMVVGDDDQMIYKFRGAAISNIMGFKDFYKTARVTVLKNNYRSAGEILGAAYAVIKNNSDRLETKLGITKKLEPFYAPQKGLKRLNIKRFENFSEEADFAAAEIERLVSGGACGFRDIGVLVRAKSDASIFLKTFQRMSIPYRFSGDEGLYSKREVRFLLSFLRALVLPYDFNPVFDMAVSEFYNIDPFTMSKIGNRAAHFSIAAFDLMKKADEYPELELDEKEADRIKLLVRDIGYFSSLTAQGWGAGEILYDYVKERRIFDSLLKENTPDADRKIANISAFFGILKQFSAADEYDTVNNFIKYIDLKQKAGENPRQGEIEGVEDDAVRVLTIHKAKGLEFKAVFVPALVQDKFPARNRASSPFPLPEPLMKDIVDEAVYAKEEERRLFYVAMTRARDALYLTCSRRYEGVSERKPSIFLFEAGLAVPDKGAEAGQSPAGIESFERKEAAPKKSGRPVKSGAVRLSNYQIDDYLTCPFKYRLIHILKMPIREQPNIIYGQAMHRVAAEYYRAKQENTPVSVDGLIKIFDALWKPRGFISREHEKKRYEAALRNIENFFIVEEKRGKVPKYIEKSFEFKLNENIVIAGRWDRIDEEDGKPMIVDYKTSDVRDMEKAKKKLSSPDIARQLTLYALAYERVFGVPVDSVAVYFFESALLAVKKIKPDTITRFMEKAEKVAEGIKNGCFDAVPGPISCRYCAFNTICPHSKADVLF